jgi:hypothetical protein
MHFVAMEAESSTSGCVSDDSHRVISDGSKDVAKNAYMDTIAVGVAGRCKLQVIYASPQTTANYEEPDAQDNGEHISILPTVAEIESRANTIPYLVVGVILAKVPYTYSTENGEYNATSSAEKSGNSNRRDVLAKVPNFLRVLISVTAIYG